METLGPKNKIQGIGLGIQEAVRHIWVKLYSHRMTALAPKIPRLTRLDILNEAARQEKLVLKVLRQTSGAVPSVNAVSEDHDLRSRGLFPSQLV